MRTYLDCIPCFYSQALKAARLSGADEAIQREVLNQLSELIPNFSLNTTPAEMGKRIYNMISKVTGKKDPFKEMKEESNKMALRVYPQLRMKMKEAQNPLLMAVQLAIAGNIIDYGVLDNDAISEEINRIIQDDFDYQAVDIYSYFEYTHFYQQLLDAESILYLADNSGEVVFDRILIEQLVEKYHKNIIYAVKGKPILNDALVDDAIFCGINQFAKIISCGADSPGVVLKYCSPEFLRIFNETEMIISKGQGNYEALSDITVPIYFLLKVKCPVVARHAGAQIGEIMLKRQVEKENIASAVVEEKEE